MRQSIFKKQLTATGKQGTVNAEVITTMNYDSKTITGTHAATHDDYSRNVPVHKVECFLNGKVWKKSEALDSELMVFNESEKWIRETNLYIQKLANEEPIKTFGEKMCELFS
jgi:hypothetical protein